MISRFVSDDQSDVDVDLKGMLRRSRAWMQNMSPRLTTVTVAAIKRTEASAFKRQRAYDTRLTLPQMS